jgi:hypothetical protein
VTELLTGPFFRLVIFPVMILRALICKIGFEFLGARSVVGSKDYVQASAFAIRLTALF